MTAKIHQVEERMNQRQGGISDVVWIKKKAATSVDLNVRKKKQGRYALIGVDKYNNTRNIVVGSPNKIRYMLDNIGRELKIDRQEINITEETFRHTITIKLLDPREEYEKCGGPHGSGGGIFGVYRRDSTEGRK